MAQTARQFDASLRAASDSKIGTKRDWSRASHAFESVFGAHVILVQVGVCAPVSGSENLDFRIASFAMSLSPFASPRRANIADELVSENRPTIKSRNVFADFSEDVLGKLELFRD